MAIDYPELTGKRLRLIPLRPEHASELYQAGRDASLWTYIPCRMQSENDFQIWIDQSLSLRDSQGDRPYALSLADSGALVGSTRFYDLSLPHRRTEIGWTWISRPWQRSFVNTEAKFLLLREAFEGLGLQRVALRTDGRNLQSQAAIERLGAKREGIWRKHLILPDGFTRDTVYYSILDSEWPEVKARLENRLAIS